MDYMLLRLVGKFLHLDGKRLRCVLSAAFGSFVSCLLLCVPFKIIFPAAVLIHGGCAFFMASFAFRLKKGGHLAKTILALYFTAFVVGGIYQGFTVHFIHWGVQPRPSDLAEGIFIRSRLNIRGRYSRHMDFLIRETSLWIP